ncbi:hypothetical protein F2Q69_00002710 [Brassica cretica]|uniref:Uncharacterized protein n=1 Tax=Brassica cretica TaxID=69181 RepID=A0A8S9P313_BRACR|nr:hypothetical protein F2Q69_00002710 [Brassica cretica]
MLLLSSAFHTFPWSSFEKFGKSHHSAPRHRSDHLFDLLSIESLTLHHHRFHAFDLDMTHSFLLRSYPLSSLRSFKPPVSDPSPTPPLSRRYFPPLITNLLPPKNPFISTVSTFSLVCSMPSRGYGVVQHLIKFLYTSAYGYGVC